MPHFVCLLTNTHNKPAEIRVISTPANLTTLTVISPFNSEADALAYKSQLEQYYLIPVTQQPARRAGKRQRVKNWTTGEIFPTAAAAARAIGVSTSAITRHLRDPQTFKEVRGNNYERINQ